MTTKEKLTPAKAVQYIVEAPSILEDGGKSVFGWVVQSPLYSALGHLQEAIDSLEGVSGAEKIIAGAYEKRGDICADNDIMQNPIRAAQLEYKKALEMFTAVNDFEALARIAEKNVKLRQNQR